MAVQGALWLAKRYPSSLISVFLTGFRYFSYQAATQLASRGWVDPVPDPIILEKFLGYSRESNPGPLGWQSDVPSTIPNRWSTEGLENDKDIILLLKCVCVPMPTHCTITRFWFHARWIDGVKCGLFSNHAPLRQTTL